ncbi:MAG: HAD family hydrolase [Rhodospirillales bacterium]|nr:HAD family hydrolase [Rhodospirillales bacterium]
MNNGRPEAVLFDWDNTLIDSWPVIFEATNATLTEFGHDPWTLEEIKGRVRKSLRNAFPEYYGDRWQEAGKFYYKVFDAIHLDRLKPLPGAVDLLSQLTGDDIYLGVVSNKRGDYLRKEAEHLGWNRYFGRLIGANDAERDKPSPDPVSMALSGSGIDPGQHVWFAGDADIDLECANNAGCLPVLVRDTPPGPGEFKEFPPARHVPDCGELAKLIKYL